MEVFKKNSPLPVLKAQTCCQMHPRVPAAYQISQVSASLSLDDASVCTQCAAKYGRPRRQAQIHSHLTVTFSLEMQRGNR